MSDTDAATDISSSAKPRVVFDYTAETAHLPSLDTTLSLAGLSEPVIRRLALRGYARDAMTARDYAKLAAAVADGSICAEKPPAQPRRKPNLWVQAMVMALVEIAKRKGVLATPEEARAKVESFDRETVNRFKTDGTVVKHYNKLAGKAEDISLFDTAFGPAQVAEQAT